MNALTIPSSLSMTSKEIAELTGKQHAHVCRDIRSMLIEVHGTERLEQIIPEQYLNRHSEDIREHSQEIVSALFGDDPKRDHVDPRGFSWERDTRGYVSLFRLDKDHTLTLLTGYDAKARFKVMQRWQELEAEAAKPQLNPANFSRLQLIELAMQAEQERIVLEQHVAVIQPKADALDRIATASDGSMCLTDAAKMLQMRPIDLKRWLLVHQWVYRRNGNKNLLGYADKLHQGLIEHKVHVERDETGVERVHENMLITPKGLAKLAAIFQPALPLNNVPQMPLNAGQPGMMQ